MHKPDLRGRAVTTLLMLFGSVVLAVSGVVLLIVSAAAPSTPWTGT